MTTKMRLLAAATLCLSAAACSDCATKAELNALKADLQATKQTADQALVTAKDAKQIAENADARSMKAEEAVSRGFKKSMYK